MFYLEGECPNEWTLDNYYPTLPSKEDGPPLAASLFLFYATLSIHTHTREHRGLRHNSQVRQAKKTPKLPDTFLLRHFFLPLVLACLHACEMDDMVLWKKSSTEWQGKKYNFEYQVCFIDAINSALFI